MSEPLSRPDLHPDVQSWLRSHGDACAFRGDVESKLYCDFAARAIDELHVVEEDLRASNIMLAAYSVLVTVAGGVYLLI